MKIKITSLLFLITFCSINFKVEAQHLDKNTLTKEPTYIGKSKNPSNEECFCYFYSEFPSYFSYTQNVVNAFEQWQINNWYDIHFFKLYEEMGQRSGYNIDNTHPEIIIKNFFNAYFSDPFAQNHINQVKNQEIAVRNSYAKEFNKTFSQRRLFQLAQNTTTRLNDLGELTYNNKQIKDMSFTEVQNIYNLYNTASGQSALNWEYHQWRINKIDKQSGFVNEVLSNYITHISNQYINYINSFGRDDKLSLYTGYLIYQNQFQSLVTQPNQLLNGVPFYYPYQHYNILTPALNSIIDSRSAEQTRYPQPPVNLADHKRDYSVLKEHLGLKTANFYADKLELLEALKDYQEFNDFNYSSRDLVKSLEEFITDDERFISDNYYRGSQSFGQTLSSPETVMEVVFSQDALNFGFKNFGKVLEALKHYPQFYEKEGELIRNFLEKNQSIFLNLTNEQLGKIFDFRNIGYHTFGIKFSDFALANILSLYHADGIYGWSIFRDLIKSKLLSELYSGNQVNFDDQIIIDSSVPLCVENIIKKLSLENSFLDLGDMPTFIKNELNLIGNIFDLFNNSSEYHLKFIVGPLAPNSLGQERNGATFVDFAKKEFRIVLNQDFVSNATDLVIARTIIHESVHAYLSFVYKEYPLSNLRESLTHLLNQNGQNQNTSQHKLMAQQFVDAIAKSLETWDSSSLFDKNYYKYLSWSGGMLDTPAFDNLSTNFQTNSRNANVNEGTVTQKSTSLAKGQNNCY